MGTPTIWDKIQNFIYHIIWCLYRQVVLKITEKEYHNLENCPLCGASYEGQER